MRKTCILIFLFSIYCFSNNLRSQYNVILNFDTINGVMPFGDLYSDGAYLYGMTNLGGDTSSNVCGFAGCGGIFKIRADGTGYAKLIDLDFLANGSNATGSLISDGVFLYGMTYGGGVNGYGTVFKIMPDGSGYQNLFNFNGGLNGSNPFGSLVYDGTYLYGMTERGGMYTVGTIFKIKPDGSSYVKLIDFGYNGYGSHPFGALIFDGIYLYGMTSGPYDNSNCSVTGCGNVFKLKTDGTGYQSILFFNNNFNGITPKGSLISDGTFLYGMTNEGGINNLGTIFRIMPNGTNYSKLLDFANDTLHGYHPFGSLLYNGVSLYGMTSGGGLYGDGTIFQIMPDGSSYLKIFDFNRSISGGYPHGTLIFDATSLYGMTMLGGPNDAGTVFKFGMSVGVEDKFSDKSKLTIHPNPAYDLISITSSINISKIKLLSLTGQIVLSESVNSKQHHLQLQNFSNGIYFLEVQYTNGMKKTEKIVKN
jgi:uncharacterized repeat protein (TIGR03803 family)